MARDAAKSGFCNAIKRVLMFYSYNMATKHLVLREEDFQFQKRRTVLVIHAFIY